jgi:5-oxoprolinase (ATP-hydrolysing) subunit A
MDLNADLGESFGAWRVDADGALLKLVTSANVACGFHAGDPGTMRAVCTIAAARGVAVGAHVGYRDLAGFGRRYIAYQTQELSDEILYQIAALDGIARASGTAVTYVKPHGALYNTALDDPGQAGAVVAAVRAYHPDLAVLCLPDSVLQRTATDAGLRAVRECFLDRAYTPAGRLVPRSTPGAVITDADAVVARAVLMATEGVVAAADGTRVPVAPESMCLHGDTPHAVELASRVHAALLATGVPLAPFGPAPSGPAPFAPAPFAPAPFAPAPER